MIEINDTQVFRGSYPSSPVHLPRGLEMGVIRGNFLLSLTSGLPSQQFALNEEENKRERRN